MQKSIASPAFQAGELWIFYVAALLLLAALGDAARAREPVVHAHLVEILAHLFVAGCVRHELRRRLPELDVTLRLPIGHVAFTAVSTA